MENKELYLISTDGWRESIMSPLDLTTDGILYVSTEEDIKTVIKAWCKDLNSVYDESRLVIDFKNLLIVFPYKDEWSRDPEYDYTATWTLYKLVKP